MSRENDQGSAQIADSELARKIEALKLLSIGETTQKSAAEQIGWSSQTLYRFKKKAMAWPVEMITTLPKTVQDFIVSENLKKNKRQDLATELEAAHKRQSKEDPFKEQINKHQDDLSRIARNFVARLRYIKQVSRKDLAEEMIDDIIIDKPGLPKVDQYLLGCLFLHMQPELPELSNIEEWGQLPIGRISDELLKGLLLRAAQRYFPNNCEVCRYWT